MKKVGRFFTIISAVFFVFSFFSCVRITVELDVPPGGVLEDAVLIVSDNGDAPRKSYVLGDIDLTQDELSFSQNVDTSVYTHWWLIGSMDDNVVFSSVLSLNGVDMYTIEPYSGSSLAWNIPNNLNAYVNGTTYSLDWWAQTSNNHNSHVAADGDYASLWKFNTGMELGTIKIQLANSD